MSTIKTGTTTTTGLVVEADTSGNLVVQTGATPTTALTISGTNQQITFAQQPVVPVPAFRAVQSTTQNNVQNGVVLAADIPIFDTNNWYNTSTYRYVPQIAGYYWFRGHVVLQMSSTVTFQQVALRKNPTNSTFTGTFSRTVHRETVATNYYIETNGMVYLNGSSDFVDVFVNGGTVANAYSLYSTNQSEVAGCFEGFLVRAA